MSWDFTIEKNSMQAVIDRLRTEVGEERAAKALWNQKFVAVAEENERLLAALQLFVGCAYPVATEINPRGHNWRTEESLDHALSEARKALGQDEQNAQEVHPETGGVYRKDDEMAPREKFKPRAPEQEG